MKYKLPKKFLIEKKFLTEKYINKKYINKGDELNINKKHINIGDELNKLFMINNTQSLFVQYGDRVECVYMSYGNEKFERCHYERNGIFVIEHYICESQFKSLYRKFLDYEIEYFNFEDVMNGCNKFYLRSEEEYKKFRRILIDM